MMYDRKLNKAFDRVMMQIEQLTASSGELSKQAEETRLRNRELQEELEAERAARGSLKSWADQEIARLNESLVVEVSKAEAALRGRQQQRQGKLKRYCKDMVEVNRITSLANQSGCIKAYLEDIKEVGAQIFEARFQSLAADKAKYIAELGALDVVEVTDADFEVTPRRSFEPSSERVVADVAASLNQYGSHMSPQRCVADLSSGSSSDEEGEVRDPSTGEFLAPLSGNPVTPAAQT
ncbi:unnamed protein product [Arabis nemorensis]|uniref:Uncharacterized protein n=1 Tax=Arabis nemorensis TaxID=586526 RepID=A0A565AXA1_9BRAS|nr:unnamed protein product [Arabis nemorensis]